MIVEMYPMNMGRIYTEEGEKLLQVQRVSTWSEGRRDEGQRLEHAPLRDL